MAKWAGLKHTCDHQTSSLGTKADHERCFALEKAFFFPSKHPLSREKRIFPICQQRKLAELSQNCPRGLQVQNEISPSSDLASSHSKGGLSITMYYWASPF
jgi:hypothetical protein